MKKCRDINEQKRLYKLNRGSICAKCSRVEEDCFDAMKFCETETMPKSEKTDRLKLSIVTRCNQYKEIKK